MSTMQTDRLVDDYLRRLDAAAAHLQRSRRTELLSEIREHIEAALQQEDDAGEVAVRNVLERLGPPEEIVAEAEPSALEASATRTGRLEIVALLALLVPFLGWLVGSVLVVVSAAWSRRDKVIGLTLLLALVVLPALAFTVSSGGSEEMVPVVAQPDEGLPDAGTESGPGPLEGFGLAMLIGLPSALYLGWRLRRHPNPSELRRTR